MKITLLILGGLLAIVLAFWAYYGGFRKINVQIQEQDKITMVYEEMKGDYSQSAEVTDRLYYKLLNEDKIETYKGIGIYFDDPRNVEKSELRSEVGCILENPDSAQLAYLKEKYLVKTLPKGKYVVAEFPFKGKMSIFMGIMKVYPALNKYMESQNIKQGGPMMEIYDVPNKKIIYRSQIIEE